MTSYTDCRQCLEYGARRQAVLAPAIAAHCRRSDETGRAALDRFMTGVHARHQAGLPILPEA